MSVLCRWRSCCQGRGWPAAFPHHCFGTQSTLNSLGFSSHGLWSGHITTVPDWSCMFGRYGPGFASHVSEFQFGLTAYLLGDGRCVISLLWISNKNAHVVWLLEGGDEKTQWILGMEHRAKATLNKPVVITEFVTFPALNLITFDSSFVKALSWLYN